MKFAEALKENLRLSREFERKRNAGQTSITIFDEKCDGTALMPHEYAVDPGTEFIRLARACNAFAFRGNDKLLIDHYDDVNSFIHEIDEIKAFLPILIRTCSPKLDTCSRDCSIYWQYKSLVGGGSKQVERVDMIANTKSLSVERIKKIYTDQNKLHENHKCQNCQTKPPEKIPKCFDEKEYRQLFNTAILLDRALFDAGLKWASLWHA
jgi:hypothetical protein